MVSSLPEAGSRILEFGDYDIFEGCDIKGRSKGIDWFYKYWQKLHISATHPQRTDLKPTDFKQYLSHIAMLDVENTDPLELRLRLMGTQVALYYGEYTGELVDDIQNAVAINRIKALSRRVIEQKHPVMSAAPGFSNDKDRLISRALYTPIFDHTGAVVIILTAIFIDYLPPE